MTGKSIVSAPQRWRAAAIQVGIGCVWLTFFAVACLWIASVLFGAFRAGRLYDFAQEWTSARNYLSGLPVYLDFGRSIALHLGGTANPTFAYNAHPPAAVLVALPFGLLPYREAYLVWNIGALVCLGLSLWMIVGDRSAWPARLDFLGLLILIVFGNALAHQLVQGQLNLLILLLIVVAWATDRRGAATRSGIAIGLAAGIKLFPFFLVLYPLGRRRWATVGAAIATFLAINAVGCLLFGLDAYGDYFFRVVPRLQKFRDALPNASLMGFWTRLFDGSLGEAIPVWRCPLLAKSLAGATSLAVTLATLAIVRGLARRASDARPQPEQGADDTRRVPATGQTPRATDASEMPDWNLCFALCCAAMLLVSPITWDHYFLLLIPGLWFGWQAARGRPVAQIFVVGVAVLLVGVNPYAMWDRFFLEHAASTSAAAAVSSLSAATLASFQFYALLAFYLWAAFALHRRVPPALPLPDATSPAVGSAQAPPRTE